MVSSRAGTVNQTHPIITCNDSFVLGVVRIRRVVGVVFVAVRVLDDLFVVVVQVAVCLLQDLAVFVGKALR